MLLGIDVGNTQTVLGVFQNQEIVKTWRVATRLNQTPDEFAACVYTLLQIESLSLTEIESVMVSSVVPSMGMNLKSAFRKATFHFVDHRFPFSYSIQSEQPQQFGADRLVNAEATVRDWGVPAIVVDLGTATTICAINETKEYLGGVIIPGMEASMESLTKKAAKLFKVELVPPQKTINNDTQRALQSGLLYGYSEMIDGMIRRFKTELKESSRLKVIATGGMSLALKDICREIDEFDPNLTMKGIGYLYESLRNR